MDRITVLKETPCTWPSRKHWTISDDSSPNEAAAKLAAWEDLEDRYGVTPGIVTEWAQEMLMEGAYCFQKKLCVRMN